jgi:hypothetical protein
MEDRRRRKRQRIDQPDIHLKVTDLPQEILLQICTYLQDAMVNGSLWSRQYVLYQVALVCCALNGPATECLYRVIYFPRSYSRAISFIRTLSGTRQGELVRTFALCNFSGRYFTDNRPGTSLVKRRYRQTWTRQERSDLKNVFRDLGSLFNPEFAFKQFRRGFIDVVVSVALSRMPHVRTLILTRPSDIIHFSIIYRVACKGILFSREIGQCATSNWRPLSSVSHIIFQGNAINTYGNLDQISELLILPSVKKVTVDGLIWSIPTQSLIGKPVSDQYKLESIVLNNCDLCVSTLRWLMPDTAQLNSFEFSHLRPNRYARDAKIDEWKQAIDIINKQSRSLQKLCFGGVSFRPESTFDQRYCSIPEVCFLALKDFENLVQLEIDLAYLPKFLIPGNNGLQVNWDISLPYSLRTLTLLRYLEPESIFDYSRTLTHLTDELITLREYLSLRLTQSPAPLRLQEVHFNLLRHENNKSSAFQDLVKKFEDVDIRLFPK